MDFVELLLFILPAYAANSVPVVLGGGMPLDFGALMGDGRRVLGENKTVRGFAAGVASGTLVGAIIALVMPLSFFATPQQQFMGGFALALGAMGGDAAGSFIKRRLGIPSGMQFFPDSVIFLIVALALVFPFADASLYAPVNLLFFLALTVILHPAFNVIANMAGLKKVPW